MNQKLRHRSIALPTLATVLVLGLLTTAASHQIAGNDQDALARAAEAAAVTALATALQHTAEAETAEASTSRPSRNATRPRRQSLLMPYFSFAPRG